MLLNSSRVCFIALSTCVLFNFISTELFTAIVDLEKLLYTEGEVIKTIERYIEAEEKRLQEIKKLKDEYGRLHQVASVDSQSFLGNPINAFLLVKRLSTDWKTAESLMLKNAGKDMIENMTQTREDLKFPEEEDLTGAAEALLRLQDTYKLDTSTLARGQISGTKPSNELTANDCFELGRQSYNSGDHYHTILWMQEALDRVDEETNKTADKAEILEYLAFSTFMQGNTRHALKLTIDLLELVPDHPRARGNKAYYEDAIKNAAHTKRGDDGDVQLDGDVNYSESSNADSEISEREQYEQLCRSESVSNLAKSKDLKCELITNGHPYYLLQPVRKETVFKAPNIVILHDVATDKEMEIVKHLAQPRLKRATVQNSKSGQLEYASYRISKSAWLKNEDHHVVAKVSQRIEDITGLTVKTAEELQVVNYGIGGHYEPHFDFARREEKNAFQSLGTGNRIATWLLYMSDVDAGGATVFPQIGVTLRPKKGAAAFWHNLHKNGEGDMLTRHAACPVLAGSKWVSNKWLHERGQEFRRPCGLHEND
ncbi:prolyl 4-hydroxylase subunit alpha-1 [Parasteatoda tepidariorum]|uniref:prolyl 4-hydroxylase subunit alpha-1 n=1 Tax=Parasteatoda tepidariorum TaxID=114398 RepID=UPI00077FC1D3|nr:prolyl 4-hydroxylase subunit alpha-1 [Parasteatoda tepidariorum]